MVVQGRMLAFRLLENVRESLYLHHYLLGRLGCRDHGPINESEHLLFTNIIFTRLNTCQSGCLAISHSNTVRRRVVRDGRLSNLRFLAAKQTSSPYWCCWEPFCLCRTLMRVD